MTQQPEFSLNNKGYRFYSIAFSIMLVVMFAALTAVLLSSCTTVKKMHQVKQQHQADSTGRSKTVVVAGVHTDSSQAEVHTDSSSQQSIFNYEKTTVIELDTSSQLKARKITITEKGNINTTGHQLHQQSSLAEVQRVDSTRQLHQESSHVKTSTSGVETDRQKTVKNYSLAFVAIPLLVFLVVFVLWNYYRIEPFVIAFFKRFKK